MSQPPLLRSPGTPATKIRALIADAHPVAQHQILAVLSAEDDVEVIGTAATCSETVDRVRRLSPDLVLLDPGIAQDAAADVVAAVGVDRMPATIIVTSCDEYAMQAFDFHALDYVLKPVQPDRLRQALDRARHAIRRGRADRLTSQLVALVDELRAPPVTSQRLILRANGRVVFVDADKIDWIEAAGNYVRVHLESTSHLTRQTMNGVMNQLGDRFFRIHRSFIVRLDRIRELRIAAGGDYDVVLTSGARLPLSRLAREALHKRLAR